MRFLVLFLSVVVPFNVSSSIVVFANQADWQAQLVGSKFITDDFDGDKTKFGVATLISRLS